jgi:hypothetical protein
MKYFISKNGSYAVGQYEPEGATIIDTPRPTSAHSWNGSEWVFDGFSAEESMNALRSQRNMKLVETDWMSGSDVTMSDAWKKYRKDLRDLPSTASPSLDENGNLTGVDWPTKPE